MLTATRYEPGDFYDEAVTPSGEPRAGYDEILEAVDSGHCGDLADRVAGAISRMGACFGSCEDGGEFPVCPIPRLIALSEWQQIERGLAQRARAINAFITDVYGDREIVSAGLIASHVLAGADYYEPAVVGLEPPGGHAPVIGFDLVRGADGRFRVLEDNLRPPSGLAYAAAVRRAVEAEFPLVPEGRRPVDPSFESLRLALIAAAGGIEDPRIAMLSDGPANSA